MHQDIIYLPTLSFKALCAEYTTYFRVTFSKENPVDSTRVMAVKLTNAAIFKL